MSNDFNRKHLSEARKFDTFVSHESSLPQLTPDQRAA